MLQAHRQIKRQGLHAGPTNYGATAEASTPWLQLALYSAARESPTSLVLLCGQRFARLPVQLAHCSHALFWPWDADAVRAQACIWPFNYFLALIMKQQS